MPKARAPLDYDRYQELHRQGLSQRLIAKELGIAESTLRDNLKVMQKALASHGLPQSDQGPPQGDRGTPQEPSHWETQGDLGIPQGPPTENSDFPEGFPQGDLGIPQNLSHIHQGPPQGDQDTRTPEVSLGPPQPDQAETTALAGRVPPPPPPGGPEDTERGPQGTPDVHQGGPPLYVHPGIPDDSEESVVGGEHIEEVHQGIPTLPASGTPQDSQGPPGGDLSPQLLEALTTAWPDLLHMVEWWRQRQRLVQDAAAPERQLERQTYHIEKRFIEAVRREADLTGESYAAIVNRAFDQYFSGKST